MNAPIADMLHAHVQATQAFIHTCAPAIETCAERLARGFAQRPQPQRLFLCGNGGSACDAMHIAGEFVGRFREARQALPAIALSADSGILTAVGNDYGFDEVFARQIAALAHAGDTLFALSTSGHSPNVVRALETATNAGLYCILLTGERGKTQTRLADEVWAVPSQDTARIQEAHMSALHMLTARVEAHLHQAQ